MVHLLKTQLYKLVLFSALFILSCSLYAQPVNLDNLLTMASLPQQKFDVYILKKNFYPSGRNQTADTVTNLYTYTKINTKKNKKTDSTIRILSKSVFKDESLITYQTTSREEFFKVAAEMREKGFYCNEEPDSSTLPALLYQKGDLTIYKYVKVIDTVSYYCLRVYEKTLPDPGDVFYADDLVAFTSHEYLEYFFGAPNVKKDIYYLSGNDMVRCSVLFSNSPRQVVFIWSDEINRTGIANLLFGGQQRLKSAMETSSFIGESNWMLKSGVHAGMTLYELRILNGSNFKFYGGNSANAGSVIPTSTGKLDFKREDIILGCMNCKDNQFYSSTVLDADEALEDGRIVFVLSVILNPNSSTSSLTAKKE